MFENDHTGIFFLKTLKLSATILLANPKTVVCLNKDLPKQSVI